MALGFLALGPLGQPSEVIAAGRAYWFAMAATLVPFAVLLGSMQFLDAIDRPWTGAALQFVTVVLNVSLNYALIWGVGPLPALGLPGAGVGSLLAGLIGAATTILYLRRAPSLAAYRDPPVAAGLSARLARNGLPLAVGYMGEGAAYAVVDLMLGLFGTVVLAANQIVQSVGGLLYMLPLGMSAAVAIRVGQASGAGAPHRLRPVAIAAIGTVAVWMLAVTAGLLLGGRAIAGALSTDPDVVSLATTMFVTVAVIQVADGVQGTALGALRGAMDFRWPTTFTLACYWLFALPLAWVLGVVLDLGPMGVWVGYGLGIALAAIVLPWRFWTLTMG
ncbi:MAG: MATE family efflux transporter [Pseudomonadota bacterium]